MPSAPHPLGNASNGQLDGRHPQIHEVKLVAFCLETPEPRRERPAGKRGLESEVAAFVREVAHSIQQYAPSRKSNTLR